MLSRLPPNNAGYLANTYKAILHNSGTAVIQQLPPNNAGTWQIHIGLYYATVAQQSRIIYTALHL
jgi:hypothetical protein